VLIITADTAGERVDVLLSRSIENMTRSSAARLLEEGAVLLCGAPVKKNYKTVSGISSLSLCLSRNLWKPFLRIFL